MCFPFLEESCYENGTSSFLEKSCYENGTSCGDIPFETKPVESYSDCGKSSSNLKI